MRFYYFSSLVIFTFGLYAFSSLFILWWKGISPNTLRMQKSQLVNGVMTLYSAAWFLANLFLELAGMNFFRHTRFLDGILGIMSFCYPPLIMHFYYVEEKEQLSHPDIWERTVTAIYGISLLASLVLGLLVTGWLPFSFLMVFPYSNGSINLINFLMTVLFAFAAIYCIALTAHSRHRTLPLSEKKHRLANTILFAAMILLFCSALFYDTNILGLTMRALPLVFIFATTYFTQKFYFYDLFIKRGVIMLLTLLLLMAFFAWVFPAIQQPSQAWTTPWLYALSLLPITITAPWFCHQLESWLDRVWFGRKFSIKEAGRYFRDSLTRVTDEDQLKREGEKVLSTIFQTPVAIKLIPEDQANSAFEPAFSLPIRSHVNNVEGGAIFMGKRYNQAPFLSEDIQLLNSLAASFTFLWDNLKMQRQRQIQDQREQELQLHASRSELKALRAQINPHFLFNALNAIAGLIHRDPNRAEETVEQLAEIFRYTLKRSEKEWVRLEEEIDFIRAYLEVEQARFGERLQIHIDADPEVFDFKIPCMMVQTLVENAVKHGISAIRGKGLIQVKATCKEGCLQVEVIDNGPGIQSSPSLPNPKNREATSYGIRNIQERLEGYFGAEARFQLARDPSGQFTIASLAIPISSRTADAEGVKS